MYTGGKNTCINGLGLIKDFCDDDDVYKDVVTFTVVLYILIVVKILAVEIVTSIGISGTRIWCVREKDFPMQWF